MDDTTIKEVRDLSAVLVAEIQVLVRQFEKTTGCFVHSIPVTPAAGQQQTTVGVKVQVTQPR